MEWDPRLDALRVSVSAQGVDKTKAYWRIIAAWITVNGSWETAPTWARKYQRDTLGGDHHAYCRALFEDGSVAGQAGFLLSWPDGQDGRLPEPDGWANWPLYASYDPRQGPGPYAVKKFGNAEALTGLGLPVMLPWATGGMEAEGGHHVSFFCVWQEMEPEPPPPPPTPGPKWERYDLRVFGLTVPVELRRRE